MFFNLVAKFLRNLPTVRALLGFAVSRTPEYRIEFLEKVEEWALDKRALEEPQTLTSSLKGQAKSLLFLDDLLPHLSRTPHLGVLAQLAPRSISRAGYVAKQAELLIDLKESHSGLGLGSRVVSIRGEPTGLEVAQTWAVLLSYGHLFSTQATERAVLFELRRSGPRRRRFVEQFGAHANLARRVLPALDIYRLNELLALKRLIDQPSSTATVFAIDALTAWFESSDPAIERLRRVFKLARRLSYLQMHSLVGLEPSLSVRLLESTVQRIAEHDGIAVVDFESELSPYESLLRELDRFHFETFFTSPAASALVLGHLREFKTWWLGREQHVDAIGALFTRPADWPTREPVGDLYPVFRFVLPAGHHAWRQEVELWWQSGAAWGSTANCFITHVPRAETLQCDVFAGRLLTPSELHHLFAQFARYLHSESVRREPRAVVGRNVTKVVHYLLEAGLRGGNRLVFRPLENAGNNQYSTAGYSRTAMVSRIQSVADDVESNPVRAHELRACAEFLDQLPDVDGAIYAFNFGRLLVLDSSNREVAEIDGVFVESTNERIALHVVEVKKSGLAGARKQLARIQDELGCGSPPMCDFQCDGASLRSFRYSWPPSGDRRS